MSSLLPEIILYNSVDLKNGKIITINEKENISLFEIKRFYWINNKSSETSYSEHAHKKLQQIIIAIDGEINISLKSQNDHKSYSFTLNNPSEGLYIPPLYWKKITYSKPCILLCLASENYDESDYIRDFSEFEK